MANVAKKIIHENGFADVTTVVPKSSLDTCIPEGLLNIIVLYIHSVLGSLKRLSPLFNCAYYHSRV